jgi:Ca2+-binding EF-hand superfamily protein
MIRKSIVLAAVLVAFAPAALLAADPASAPARGPRGDGQWFNRLDTNHDGVIAQDEATAASEARIAKSFDKLDANHDGMITQEEVRAAGEARREEMKAEAAARFKAADKNGDGFLSKEEATAGMPMLARHFDTIDTNKDGQVTPEELAAARTHFGGGRNGRGHGVDPVQR